MAIQTLGLTVPEKRSNNPTAPLSVGWHNLFDHGYSDAGGVDVNPHTVMQSSSSAAACVRLISSSIASLPLLLYAKNGNSKTQLLIPFTNCCDTNPTQSPTSKHCLVLWRRTFSFVETATWRSPVPVSASRGYGMSVQKTSESFETLRRVTFSTR